MVSSFKINQTRECFIFGDVLFYTLLKFVLIVFCPFFFSFSFYCSHFEKYGDITDLYMPKVLCSLWLCIADLMHNLLFYLFEFLIMYYNFSFISNRIKAQRCIVELVLSLSEMQVRPFTVAYVCTLLVSYSCLHILNIW